jgi:hypothetical protein
LVRHEAVSPNLYARIILEFIKKVDVMPKISLAEKSLLAAISPLRNVVGDAVNNHACDSSHVSIQLKAQMMVVVSLRGNT